MCNNIIELDLNFVFSHHLAYSHDYFYGIAQYETMVFSALEQNDVIATFTVISYTAIPHLKPPFSYHIMHDSPLCTWYIYPKCPENAEIFVMLMFLEFFFERFPQHNIIYVAFKDEEMKEALLKIGFQYLEDNIVYYQKEKGSD